MKIIYIKVYTNMNYLKNFDNYYAIIKYIMINLLIKIKLTFYNRLIKSLEKILQIHSFIIIINLYNNLPKKYHYFLINKINY